MGRLLKKALATRKSIVSPTCWAAINYVFPHVAVISFCVLIVREEKTYGADIVHHFLFPVVFVHVPEESSGFRGLGCIDERDDPPAEGKLAIDEVRDMLVDPYERMAVGHIHREDDVVQVERNAGELAAVGRQLILCQ